MDENAQRAAVPSQEDVESMVELSDIRALLESLNARERAMDADLASLLSERSLLENRLETLNAINPKLSQTRRDMRRLAETVGETCVFAERVSGRVRQLDRAQTRLDATLRKVTDIVELKGTMESLEAAVEAEDFNTALAHIRRYAQFDPAVLEDASTVQRQALEKRLRAVVRERFDEAVAAGDRDGISRFAQMFAPLDLAEEGLTRFAQHLRASVARSAAANLARALGTQPATEDGSAAGLSSDGPLSFIDVLSALFDDIAFAVDEETDLLEETFGEGAMLFIVRELQNECDVQGVMMLETYMEVRRLEALMKEVEGGGGGGGGGPAEGGAEAAVLDAREYDMLLSEMTFISQRSAIFDGFMRNEAAEAAERQAAATAAVAASSSAGVVRPSPIVLAPGEALLTRGRTTVFASKVQEVMTYYFAIETHALNASIAKALAMDVVEDGGGGQISSMVDDLFYVVQKSLRRVIATGDANAVCALINIICSALDSEVRSAFQQSLLEHHIGVKKNLIDGYHITLNNMDVTATYVGKLKQSAEAWCYEAFADSAEDKGKITVCLDALDGVGETYRSLLADAVGAVRASLKLKAPLDGFVQTSYDLTEAQFSANEIRDPFVSGFLQQVSSLLDPFRTLFTEGNFDALVHATVEYVTEHIERVLLRQKRFNQLGGLQFDKDVRALSAFFSRLTQTTVREQFARLSQIATLLNIDRVSEVHDYWGTMTWRLSKQDVKRCLRLRSDFRAEDISRLKLT